MCEKNKTTNETPQAIGSNSIGLLDCPFCGGKAHIDDCRLIWRIVCSDCESLVLGERAPEPEDDRHAESIDWDWFKNTAINKWNKRVTV